MRPLRSAKRTSSLMLCMFNFSMMRPRCASSRSMGLVTCLRLDQGPAGRPIGREIDRDRDSVRAERYFPSTEKDSNTFPGMPPHWP